MSQVPQELVGTLRHVDTVDTRMARAFSYDNTILLSSTKLPYILRQEEIQTLISILT